MSDETENKTKKERIELSQKARIPVLGTRIPDRPREYPPHPDVPAGPPQELPRKPAKNDK